MRIIAGKFRGRKLSCPKVVTRPTLGDFVVTRGELLTRCAQLFGWVTEGRLEVRVGTTYPLTEAGRAHEDLEGRRTTGKVLLLP